MENINNIYAVGGILISALLFLIIMIIIMRKNSQKLIAELQEQKNLYSELKSAYEYEKNQNLINTQKIENLKEYKERFSGLEEDFYSLKEMYDSLKPKYDALFDENEKINAKVKEYETQNSELYEQNRALSVKNSELSAKKESLENELESALSEKNELNKKLSSLHDQLSAVTVENRELQTKLKESEKAFEEKMELLKRSEDKLKTAFENLANEILEQTKEKMTKTSKESLTQILNPLQNQMKEFREKIEVLSKDEAEKISALQNELKNLKELSHKLSSDAENLTKALKGESKTQGNWGELVLERVLELSGLVKGREYEREVSLSDEDNKRYRPDVIVHLPNSRDIIIDAKTSLNAYQEYIKTEDKTYIKAHIQALKNHIDTLAEKKYENLKGVNTLDFVFMFIPVENALLVALENDPGLFEYAFKKRVVLVSPTTLLVSLRAIESSWRFERQAKNIDEVVKTAESLYDKVRGFSEDFEKIGKSLENAQKSFDNAKNKLTSGRGNVLRQVEILKEKAGIKPKKEISKELRGESE